MATLTYLQVIARIAARLGRDDLDPDPAGVTIIRDTIVDLIDYYKSEALYNAQVTDTSLVTVSGTALYALPAGWEEVERVDLLQGAVRLPLHREGYDYINSINTNSPSIRLLPLYWCLRGENLMLGPGVANGTYPLELSMSLPPGPPSADNAANFWTGDGRMLVINGACAEICDTYIHDPVRAAKYRPIEQRELARLQAKTTRARGGIQVKAYL